MGLLNVFHHQRKPSSSAKIAKERLQIVIAHERQHGRGLDYLPLLKKDLLEVVQRYVKVSDDAITMRIEKSEGMEILELNITLPERSESKSSE
ncbi:MAG TPA: cell division topological specificity factor MinE [Halothiobacillus sp.]|nr:cell division topological specificity factor MinE [Halothiobacillus sp.]